MTGWRYIATRMEGNGDETVLDWEVPLSKPELREELSGPGGLSGIITPEVARLKHLDGRPLLEPWSTAIYAEKDGIIRSGSLVVGIEEDGPQLAVDCVGFTEYPSGMPYTGPNLDYVRRDPLDVVRDIWAHLQSQRQGNLGVTVSPLKSPMRVGEPEEKVAFRAGETNVDFLAGPYRINYVQTKDLGKEIDDLATEAPFDYWIEHRWEDADSNAIRHFLNFAYPARGARKPNLRFVVGENVTVQPKLDYEGESFASEVMVLGAGEGRKMVRGLASRTTKRLRRVAVVEDKTITSAARANTFAAAEVAWRLGEVDVDEITVSEHPFARYGSYSVGDEILVSTGAGWTAGVDLWCKITATTHEPETGLTRVSISRAEKLSR